MARHLTFNADIVVVGSGPGGATLARQLTRAGKKVALFERGVDHRKRWHYGTYVGALRYTDKHGFLYTKEGLNIIRPLMVGGATSMYCGCAAPPPPWFKEKYNVDLDTEVADTIRELGIAELPEALRGKASTRIAHAARALGYDWQPQLKFMRPARCKGDFKCAAKCMLGCRCGAKWSAAEFVDDAVREGADLYTRACVETLMLAGKRCVGVRGHLRGKRFTAHAERVILCAGGIGSPRILHDSGIKGAGKGMAMDTTVMVYGFRNERGTGYEPPMTWSWEDPDAGYMLSTLVDPWLMYPLITMRKGFKYPMHWPQWGRMLGVMIKLRDEISGGVFPNGKISKPITRRDADRLADAERIARRILIETGAKRSSIFTTPQRGTHPSGTIRIGDMVNENLETEISGLHVCDASVFPEALGRPTVLTIVALAKRLAKHLTPQPITIEIATPVIEPIEEPSLETPSRRKRKRRKKQHATVATDASHSRSPLPQPVKFSTATPRP